MLLLPIQVLFRGWIWSGIILWDLCLVSLSYLLLARTSANVEGQVKRILIFKQCFTLLICFANKILRLRRKYNQLYLTLQLLHQINFSDNK